MSGNATELEQQRELVQQRGDALVAYIYPPIHPELGSKNLGDDIRRQGEDIAKAKQEAQNLLDTIASIPASTPPLWLRMLGFGW